MVRNLKQTSGNNAVAVNLACQTLEVSRSGYYAWLTRPESERAKSNRELTERLRVIHVESRGTYGSPRLKAVYIVQPPHIE